MGSGGCRMTHNVVGNRSPTDTAKSPTKSSLDLFDRPLRSQLAANDLATYVVVTFPDVDATITY